MGAPRVPFGPTTPFGPVLWLSSCGHDPENHIFRITPFCQFLSYMMSRGTGSTHHSPKDVALSIHLGLANPDALSLNNIAVTSSGTYSCIELIESIHDAFA